MITVHPFPVGRALGAVALLLVLASVAGQLSAFLVGHDQLKGFVRLFDLNEEGNVPTFFSVLMLLVASALLAVIATLESEHGAPDVAKWIALSVGFLLMAYDEAFAAHERLIGPLRALLGHRDLGIFYYAWVIPGMALVAVLGLFFLRFLLRLPRRTRTAFLAAAALYLGGAIGMEMVGGSYYEAHGRTLAYTFIYTAEESLEMAGAIAFIVALLDALADHDGAVRVRFAGPRVRVADPAR